MGRKATFATDMYSFGVVLFFMHFPDKMQLVVPGNTSIPNSSNIELSNLITKLVDVDDTKRPTAVNALTHPYFRDTFVDNMLNEGEVVEQDKKLDAVRDVLRRVRSENRINIERITVNRENIVQDVLACFRKMNISRMRALLKVSFVNEPGVDEGGIMVEMFTLFFEKIFSGEGGYFEGSQSYQESEGVISAGDGDDDDVDSSKVANRFVLPASKDAGASNLDIFFTFGKILVKTLYEGCRIGNRLNPSLFKYITGTQPNFRDLQMFDPVTARSLQWTLATVNVNDFGLHFESVGKPGLGTVTDENKSHFVKLKIDKILVTDREDQLEAIRNGFKEALHALSEEGAPFMSLLSHTDWRVLLCGETRISSAQIIASLKFSGFRKTSMIPQWLKNILVSFPEDMLRKFLVFITGSPSLPTARGSRALSINVRAQPISLALPVAHTCFFHLDVPEYKDKETLYSKLNFAIQNSNTFEIV